MRVRWLGWAGVELEVRGASLVIDLLGDAGGVLAGSPDLLAETSLPELAPPPEPGRAVAGLCTHLHRDHADAGALSGALRPGAVVLHPEPGGGGRTENLWLAQAESELAAIGLTRRAVRAWESLEVGPFRISALPAVDGIGDPQVSWAVEADGQRIVHLGDTMFHGYWWRAVRRFGPFDVAFAPINGPALSLPHCQPPSPLPGALDPEQAALAAELLRASGVVPIHYGPSPSTGATNRRRTTCDGSCGHPRNVRMKSSGFVPGKPSTSRPGAKQRGRPEALGRRVGPEQS